MKAASHEAVNPVSPGNARGSQAADRLRLIFVWAVWQSPHGIVPLYTPLRRNIPYMDDWEIIPIITGHIPVTLKWAWAQHNEHRILIPKLILAFLFRWVASDFRTGLYFNAGLLSSSAALMIVLAHRLRGHQRLTDAVLPLSILTLAQSKSYSITRSPWCCHHG